MLGYPDYSVCLHGVNVKASFEKLAFGKYNSLKLLNRVLLSGR